MEELLSPQICMDVDDEPIVLDKNDDTDDEKSEKPEQELDDDEKVKLLLETESNDPAQVPDELTEFEKEAKKNVFAIGEPSIQFQRLHCTACNVHLGSAPVGHFNRYIHPLLKVLLCKSCYTFYRSGEFDKDEDGSEMYCRWCGQGGKVMCCAQCAFVFCQKCVRQNLGRKTLEIIKDSDDWKCFACNPTQLINMKIICTSLFEFVQEEIRLSKALNNAERLKIDHSVCCQKWKTAAGKRKRSDEDATYHPNAEWENQVKPSKKSAPSILKHTLTQPVLNLEPPTILNSQMRNWDSQDEDEVVCTPDLPSLIDDEDKPPVSLLPRNLVPPLTQIQNKQTPNNNRFTLPTLQPARPDGGRKYVQVVPKVTPAVVLRPPITANNLNFANNSPAYKGDHNFIRLQSPAVKFVTPRGNNRVMQSPIVNTSPAQIVPGLKHEWFEKAATIISTITGNLSTTLVYLTKEQKTARTVEQLAAVHNKLQELLSTSVNSLIQVRKNLRNEFLGDLNKLKFTDGTNVSSSNNNVGKKNNANNIDDDDVIVINPDPMAMKKKTTPKVTTAAAATPNEQPRPYLKVRSVSQLLSVPSECITIPDDPPPAPSLPPLVTRNEDEVVSVDLEKDPLSLSPDHDILAPNEVVNPKADAKAAEKENKPKKEKKKPVEKENKSAEEDKPAENKEEENKVAEDENKPSEKENEPMEEENEATEEKNKPTEEEKSKPTEEESEHTEGDDNKAKNDNEPKENGSTAEKTNNTQADDLIGCDEKTFLMIKNALTESKIDLLVEENLKYSIEDVPENEVRKVLSVRVLLATNYRSNLPKNRLKTADWFTEDIEAILGGNILIRAAQSQDSDADNVSSEPEDVGAKVKKKTNDLIEDGEERKETDLTEDDEKRKEINLENGVETDLPVLSDEPDEKKIANSSD